MPLSVIVHLNMLTHTELQQAFDDATPVLWKQQLVLVVAFESDSLADGDVVAPEVVTSVTVKVLSTGAVFEVTAAELALEH